MSLEDRSSDNNTGAKGDAEILRVALERFQLCEESEAEFRREAIDDLEFSAGKQWDPEVESERKADRRPCLVINKVQAHVHQLTNDQRQNRPAIKVSPVDSQEDLETAKIYQGLIRHIEYSSGADVAYATGFDSAGRCGLGYWRVVTEYSDPFSFKLEARIKRVADRFSVYLDPNAQELDGSDASYGFVFEDLSKSEFKAQFPNAKLCSMNDWESLGNQVPEWIKKDGCRVAEYFYKDFEKTTIVLLSNGQVVRKDQLPKAPATLPSGIEVVNERVTLLPTIYWVKFNGHEILEKTIWPGSGKWIPIIRTIGEELVINGRRHISGIVRAAKDPQRMNNYMASAEAEAIALTPRAPYIGAEGQFEGHEQEWANANRKNYAFLQYKPTSFAGQLCPPPQRNAFEPATQAITQSRMMASDDLKSTTGYHDAALGAQSNETSGIAIRSRANQAQLSNFHLIDNQAKAIRHTGRVLVDIIPYIYDTAQAARIIGEDGNEEIVRINEEFERNGQMVRYDLGRGKYDVTVSTGPSYETKRQEAAASMIEFVRALPQQAAAISDLIAKAQDWPWAQEISERFHKMLPPEIANDQKGQKIPPQAQAQMQQMSQMIEQLTQNLNDANQKIETKTLELESRERIEFAKLQTNIELEMAKMGSVESLALLKHEIEQINRRLDLVRIDEPIEEDFENGGAGPDGAAMPPVEQPLTGEQTAPGSSMGEMP